VKATLLLSLLTGAFALAGQEKDGPVYTDTFLVDEKDLATSGRNPYFILEPGYQLYFESPDKKETLTITVLDETKKVAGIETRVVEEREIEDGKVKELSRNYFAICRRTNSVYYFGEDAGGAWLHGEKGARFGLMMPGTPLAGSRFYQEVAPGAAMDRSEILSTTETFEAPAGKFEKVLKVLETTPLEPKEHALKLYAPGVGLIQEGNLKLVKYGNAKK
jgi:exonuclease VII small subunit